MATPKKRRKSAPKAPKAVTQAPAPKFRLQPLPGQRGPVREKVGYKTGFDFEPTGTLHVGSTVLPDSPIVKAEREFVEAHARAVKAAKYLEARQVPKRLPAPAGAGDRQAITVMRDATQEELEQLRMARDGWTRKAVSVIRFVRPGFAKEVLAQSSVRMPGLEALVEQEAGRGLNARAAALRKSGNAQQAALATFEAQLTPAEQELARMYRARKDATEHRTNYEANRGYEEFKRRELEAIGVHPAHIDARGNVKEAYLARYKDHRSGNLPGRKEIARTLETVRAKWNELRRADEQLRLITAQMQAVAHGRARVIQAEAEVQQEIEDLLSRKQELVETAAAAQRAIDTGEADVPAVARRTVSEAETEIREIDKAVKKARERYDDLAARERLFDTAPQATIMAPKVLEEGGRGEDLEAKRALYAAQVAVAQQELERLTPGSVKYQEAESALRYAQARLAEVNRKIASAKGLSGLLSGVAMLGTIGRALL